MKHLWLVLLGSSLWLSGCKSDCELNDSLRLFAGDAALDCGTAHSAADRDAVDQCATDAFEAGSAFIARYERTGVDSNLVVALASNSDGKLKLFRWDSAPCGSSSCDPVTDVQSCEKPSATQVSSDDPTALPISCESLGLPERICN
jgi:hypothetical protein